MWERPDFFFGFVFSTGLVQLYIARLPLRSCWTIRVPSVQGAIPMSIFVSGSSRIQTHSDENIPACISLGVYNAFFKKMKDLSIEFLKCTPFV